MHPPDAPHDDFQRVQRCLDGCETSLAALHSAVFDPVVGLLIRNGATPSLAEEIFADIWSDAFTPGSDHSVAAYQGHFPVASWLSTAALNRYISLRRRDHRRQELLHAAPDDAAENLGHSESHVPAEAPLIEILRGAIEKAFATCNAEHFVMIQLSNIDRLTVTEIATLFGCSPARVSRHLEAARAEIQQLAMEAVKVADPHLQLTWPDFLELCQSAPPACFGVA